MNTKGRIEAYTSGVSQVFSELSVATIEKIVNLLMKAYDDENQIFTMGNGGHGSTASHFINDLVKHAIVSDAKDAVVVKGKRFKAMCLCDSMATLTTWANDLGYENCFSEQLINWIKKDDIVFGFSASGNSKNVLKAFKVAKDYGATTICFSGGSGGRAKEIVDISFIVPSDNYLFIEDVHLSVVHLLCEVVRAIIQEKR